MGFPGNDWTLPRLDIGADGPVGAEIPSMAHLGLLRFDCDRNIVGNLEQYVSHPGLPPCQVRWVISVAHPTTNQRQLAPTALPLENTAGQRSDEDLGTHTIGCPSAAPVV